MDVQPSAAPPVVAVVVAKDPGDWFDEVLGALAAQDYPNVSVLVIDAGSDELVAGRVAARLPDAYVRRLDDNPGYGPAANEALNLVEGAGFFCFMHDDVALEPATIRLLVEEAYRSNAGILGPKLVEWDDPRRLLAVGVGVDKAGVQVPLVERGELDQEQHDAVRDVFMVPGACMLVRVDLFDALDGFDPDIPAYGEDLDLCWRAARRRRPRDGEPGHPCPSSPGDRRDAARGGTLAAARSAPTPHRHEELRAAAPDPGRCRRSRSSRWRR